VRSTGPCAKTGTGRRKRRMKMDPARENIDNRQAIPDIVNIPPSILRGFSAMG
jgi:hypothetical protein